MLLMLFPLLSLTSLATSSPASVAEKKNDWIIHDQDIVVNYITPLSWGVYLSGTFWERWIQVIHICSKLFVPIGTSHFPVFTVSLPIECFHSRGQHLCKFIGKKESVCIRKEFKSHKTGLGHQHGRRFIVLGHPIWPPWRQVKTLYFPLGSLNGKFRW